MPHNDRTGLDRGVALRVAASSTRRSHKHGPPSSTPRGSECNSPFPQPWTVELYSTQRRVQLAASTTTDRGVALHATASSTRRSGWTVELYSTQRRVQLATPTTTDRGVALRATASPTRRSGWTVELYSTQRRVQLAASTTTDRGVALRATASATRCSRNHGLRSCTPRTGECNSPLPQPRIAELHSTQRRVQLATPTTTDRGVALHATPSATRHSGLDRGIAHSALDGS
jgi:hypothetical protein